MILRKPILKMKYAVAILVGLCIGTVPVLPLFAQAPAVPQAKIRVACIGDSITAGAFVDSAVRWTTVLQSDLGPGYDVENYGVSGTTLIKNGDSPYWKQHALTDAAAFQPNIVLIMLGTNDSKPQNLPAHPGEFQPDLRALIAEFTALPTHPKVWLALPPPVFGNGLAGISEDVLATTIRPAIREVARQTKCPVIDLGPTLASHPEDSRDHVHPNPAGHKLMGDAIAANLQGKKAN